MGKTIIQKFILRTENENFRTENFIFCTEIFEAPKTALRCLVDGFNNSEMKRFLPYRYFCCVRIFQSLLYAENTGQGGAYSADIASAERCGGKSTTILDGLSV